MDRDDSTIYEYYLNRYGRYYFRTADKKRGVSFKVIDSNWAKNIGLKYNDKFKFNFKTADNG